MTAPSSVERLLAELKHGGPLTAAELGAALGISAEGARQHLLRLANAGLVEAHSRNSGVGRPAQYWQLTESSHGHFPDSHAELSQQLLTSTCRAFGEAGLKELLADRERTILNHYRAAMAGAATLAQRLARLAQLRSDEGYMARWERDGAAFLLIEDHCPIRRAADLCNGLCASELTLFRALFKGVARVERTRHLLGGDSRCVYRITPQ